jgi:hypothetical protein
VFSNLELTDYGGNYPTVKVEVIAADLPPTFINIVDDVLVRCGLKRNKPVLINSDYIVASDPTPTVVLDGYILSQDVSDYRNEIANLMQVFRKMAIRTHSAWSIPGNIITGMGSANSRRIQPTLAFIPSEGISAAPPPEVSVGVSTSMYKIPQPYAHEYKDADKFPSDMQLSYIQPRLDFEREVVVASRASQGQGDTTSLSINAVIQNRSVASSIAIYLIREGWNKVNHIKFATAKRPKLGYLLAIPSLENEPALRVIPDKLEIGADGRTRVLGVVSSVPVADAVGENAVVINTYGNTTDTGPENIIWTEGPSQDGGVTRSALVIIAPRVGALDSGTFGTVLASTDSGATYNDINTSLTPNSLKVPLTGTSIYSGPANVIDTGSVLSIVVPEGVQLYSITTEQLWERSRNLLYVEGRGMIAFQTATLTAANTYALTGILWDVLGTEDDQLFASALPSFGWLMSAALYSVPISYPTGTILRLGIFDEAGTIYSFYEKSFQNLNQSPRPALMTQVKFTSAGELVVDWTPGASQTSGTPALLFEDNINSATSHTIYVYSYDKVTGTYTTVNPPVVVSGGTVSTYTFNTAQVAAFTTATRSNLAVVVVPSNGLGIPQPSPRVEAAHVTARTNW